MWPGECEWRHGPEACAEELAGFEKSQLVEFCRRKKKVDFRLLTEALRRVRAWWWGGQIEKSA